MRSLLLVTVALIYSFLLGLMVECYSPSGNPYDRSNTKIYLFAKASGHSAGMNSYEDSVGNRIYFGVESNFPGYLDSIQLLRIFNTGRDSLLKKISLPPMVKFADTLWDSLVFYDSGSIIIEGKAFINNGKTVSDSISLKIDSKPINHKPKLSISGKTVIDSGAICLLTVSVSDSDATQKDSIYMVRGPGNSRLTDTVFSWTAPLGFVGQDSVVFCAKDNGYPPMYDTLCNAIIVNGNAAIRHPPKYLLTVYADTGGSITAPTMSKDTVDSGLGTTITASPDTGYTFSGWTMTSGTATIANANFATTTVTLTSGNANVRANFALKSPSNHAPVFSTTPARMTATATVGSSYRDTVVATDTDGDTVRYSFIDSVAGMSVGSTNGIALWTPNTADTGSRTIRLRASDGRGGLDTLAWTIICLVAHLIQASPATPSGPISGEPLKGYEYVTNPLKCSRNDPVQYLFNYDNGDSSGWINSYSDSISWPDYGIYNIRVRARCAIDTSLLSGYSGALSIGILTLKGSDNVTLLDDCESGMKEQNRWKGHWYAWDDSINGGNSIITNLIPLPGRGIPDSSQYEFKFTPNEGNPSGSANNCVRIDYKFGDKKPISNGSAYSNELGFGTTLSYFWNPYSLVGATAISFWAKAAATVSGLFRLEIGTSAGKLYYLAPNNFTTQWQKISIRTDSLKQADWSTPKAPLDLSKVTNIDWAISYSGPNAQTGTIWIDDVHIEGYTWKP